MESINNRAVEASVNFLTRKGYEILDRDWQAVDGQRIDIVAKDDEDIAFVAVTAKLGPEGFAEPTATRSSRETAAAQWLAANGSYYSNVAIRFDDIAMMVISGSRALLRHHINALASLED